MYRVRRGGFRRNNARQRKNAGSRPAQPDIAGPPKKKSKMSKGKKATLAVLAVVLVLAIGAAALLANWYFSPEEKLLRALDEEDYDAALEIYGEELEGEKSEALTDKMTERLARVREDFTSGALDYSSAKTELAAIRRLYIPDIMILLSEAEDYVDSLNDSRTAFNTAESMLAAKNYSGAMEQYALVLETDENYETALAHRKEAAEAYCEEMLSKAEAYAAENLYSDAISVLHSALAFLPDDARLTEALRINEDAATKQEKAEVLKAAEDYAKNADYENAMKTIAGTANYADDPQLKAAYQKYCGEYAAAVTVEADGLIAQKDFNGAISLLEKALAVLPDNTALSEKLQKAEESKPVSIVTLTEINQSGWGNWNDGNPIDPFGNDYSSVNNYHIEKVYGAKDFIEYRLYGEYGTITGTIAPYTDMEEGNAGYVQIFADEELVYTSPEIRRKTDAFAFSVDIGNADYIKIYVCNDNHNWAQIILSNVMLWKN